MAEPSPPRPERNEAPTSSSNVPMTSGDGGGEGRKVDLPSQQTPASKSAVYGGTTVRDITDEFTKAASALHIGQLVKDERFTLFESVGALEIMDPKMDSGLLQPGEVLEEDYDASRELLPEQVIGIIDHLLCSEMAWHQGYPLSQTVFTSVYIDRLLWPEPKSLSDAQFWRGKGTQVASPLLRALRAYCLGLIKCCDCVVQRVTSRDYWEEEDLSTHTYNRNLLTPYSASSIEDILDEALEELKHYEQENGHNASQKELINAIAVRLDFRKTLLIAVDPLVLPSELPELWKMATESLPHLMKSHELGKPVPDAFSSKIQRRLASTIPPRPVVEVSYDEAFRRLEELCADCSEAVRAVKIDRTHPQACMAYMWAFNSRKPQPLAYPRACLAHLMFSSPADAFEALIRKDLEGLILCEDTVMDPMNWAIESPRNPFAPPAKGYMMAEVINEFVAKTFQPFMELWTALCQNRCRTRRILTHSIISFNLLQADAEELDRELYTLTNESPEYRLSKWVYHHKLRIMEWVVQLGFEQDLYLPDEVAGMYWWLSTLAAARGELLESIDYSLANRETRLMDGKKVQKAKHIGEVRRFVGSLKAEATGTASFAEALSDLYAHLHYLGIMKIPDRPFNDPSLRYEARMKPYLTVDPPQIPDVEEYLQAIHQFGPYENPVLPPSDLDRAFSANIDGQSRWAKDDFSRLRSMGAQVAQSQDVEDAWNKDLANVLRSCVAAGIVNTTIKSACEKGQASRETFCKSHTVKIPEPGKRYHDWWLVPELVKKDQ